MARDWVVDSGETGLYLSCTGYRQGMSSHRFHHVLPLLAVLGSVTAFGLGTSIAKQLFPVVGSLGTTALRVGFSALLLLLIWRPWRWSLAPADRMSLLRYGVALGLMNLLFYMSLRTIPFGIAVAIEFSGPLAVALYSSRKPVDFVWLVLAIARAGIAAALWRQCAGAGRDRRALCPGRRRVLGCLHRVRQARGPLACGPLGGAGAHGGGHYRSALRHLACGCGSAGSTRFMDRAGGGGDFQCHTSSRWRWWPSSACRKRPSAS